MSASLFGGPIEQQDAQLSESPGSTPSLFSSPPPSPSHQQPDQVSFGPALTRHDPLPSDLTLADTDHAYDSGSSEGNDAVPTSQARVGWAKRYRRLIEHERDIASALEAAENNDLAVQLYNSFAVSKNARRTNLSTIATNRNPPEPLTSRHSKRRWTTYPNFWLPPSRWTAWPLHPSQAPAEGEIWDQPVSEDAPATFRPKRQKLSDELEDEITCVISRAARQHVKHSQFLPTSMNPSIAHGLEADASNSDSSMYEVKPQSDMSASSHTAERKGPRDHSYSPVPIADEIEILRTLQPAARDILGHLDKLLLALQKSRQHQLKYRLHADSESEGHDEDAPTLNRRARRKLLQARDWSEVLGMASMIGLDMHVIEKAKDRCAALFDESFEYRTLSEGTAKLDSALFKPDLTEDAMVPAENEIDLTPKPAPSEEPEGWQCQEPECSQLATFESRKDLSRHMKHQHGLNTRDIHTKLDAGYGRDGFFLCPEHSCPRSKADKAITRRARWLLHIRKTHGYEYRGPDLVVWRRTSNEPKIFYCPDPDCNRHGWAYPSQWRLNEHMHRAHGVRSSSRPGRPRSGSRSSAGPLSDADDTGFTTDADLQIPGQRMLGGVHVDGFLESIELPDDYD